MFYGINLLMGVIMKKFHKNKKAGFTLVEIIVTLVITIVVIGISSSILISTTNIFGKTALRDMQQSVAETVLGFATDAMLYASDLNATDAAGANAASVDGKAVVGIDGNGQLVFLRAGDTGEPRNIFGNSFYSNYQVTIIYEVVGPPDLDSYSVIMTVELTDNRTNNAEVVLTRTMTRPLLNFKGDVTAGPVTIAGGNYIIIS